MKPLLCLLMATLLLCAACNKKTELDDIYWTVNGQEIKAVNVTRTPHMYLEASTGSSYVRFHFLQFPTATTSYHLVSAAQQPPAADELYVTAAFKNQTWSSTGLDTSAMIYVIVKDDNKGRLVIYTADMWLHNADHTDSIKLSAHVTEF